MNHPTPPPQKSGTMTTMKILTLNIWGGRAGSKELLSFIASHGEDVDVFCFQEVWSAPYTHLEGTKAGGLEINHQNIMVYALQGISEALPNHQYFFHPHHLENYGLMMLVRKGINILGSGDVFVHKERGYVPEGDLGHHARNLQYVTVEQHGTQVTVLNFHGLWNGKGKTDSDERLEQSRNVLNFIEQLNTPVVLCGDFNLLPDTESIKMFESAGLRNLIRENGITSTRTTLYEKPVKFADYIFTSSNVDVKDFRVLPDVVSDHAPLSIEIQ